MIVPTIGRQVWFHPCPVAAGVMTLWSEQPCAATVIHVRDERCVNLSVFDHVGKRHVFTAVTLLQDDDVVPADANYAEWMPYQVGQARAAALEGVHPVHTAVAAMNEIAATAINPGDIVCLKSGGPDMTVESIPGGGNVCCSWGDGNGVKHHSIFPVATLVLVLRSGG